MNDYLVLALMIICGVCLMGLSIHTHLETDKKIKSKNIDEKKEGLKEAKANATMGLVELGFNIFKKFF